MNRLFHANLTVINIGDTFVTGPEEAAFAIRHLIRPKPVIPSHANKIATTGGVVNAGTRTARFIELPHLPGNREHDDEGSRCLWRAAALRWTSMARRAAGQAVTEPLQPPPREGAVYQRGHRPASEGAAMERGVAAA